MLKKWKTKKPNLLHLSRNLVKRFLKFPENFLDFSNIFLPRQIFCKNSENFQKSLNLNFSIKETDLVFSFFIFSTFMVLRFFGFEN